MIYEVINPSDAVTIECGSPLVAGLSVLLLGEGRYGAEGEDGSTAIPLMLFGGEKAVARWLAGCGYAGGLGDALAEHRGSIARCLRTAMVCSIDERRGLIAAVVAGGGDEGKVFAALNDARRTSMNNICGRAYAIAERYERAEQPND